MKQLKKWLGCLLCAALLCGTLAAIGLSASAMDTINLLPADAAAYTVGTVEGQVLDGSFTADNGVLTMNSTGKDGYRIHIAVNQKVTLADAISLFTKVDSDVPFNIALVFESVNGDNAWMGFASDFYNRFSARSDGLQIEAGNYERELNFSDACTFNVNIPTDECLIKEIQIAMKAADGTLTLSQMELGDPVSPSPVLDETGNPVTTVAPTTAAPTTAAVTTTAQASDENASGNMGWIIAGIAAAVVVGGIIVAAVVISRKKKA